MRCDLSIYWIEDTPTWRSATEKLLKLELLDSGISVDFICESNTDTARREIENSCIGFKKYDLFFVDLNISSDIDGTQIINALRKNHIDVDILFYSADKEKDIRDTVSQDFSSFEGVYIANRKTFQEKAIALIEKNARKLLSIQNIRGKLMDCTSENDFIITSYILEKYRTLTKDQKDKLDEVVKEYLVENIAGNAKKIESECARVSEHGIAKIKDFITQPSFIVPLELKYLIFGQMLSMLGEDATKFENYFDKIVKKRNVLAHKKLDICDHADHIKYCDTLSQFKSRQCVEACEECTSSYSIAIDEWDEIRKNANDFSSLFDEILCKL